MMHLLYQAPASTLRVTVMNVWNTLNVGTYILAHSSTYMYLFFILTYNSKLNYKQLKLRKIAFTNDKWYKIKIVLTMNGYFFLIIDLNASCIGLYSQTLPWGFPQQIYRLIYGLSVHNFH